MVFFFMLLLGVPAGHAQQAIASAGGSGAAGGYKVDWTLGEPVIETFRGSGHILTQGLHQTNIITTSLPEREVPGLAVRVYPNPVGDRLMIEVVRTEGALFRCELYDVTGHRMLQKSLDPGVEEITMGGFAPGLYFLRVLTLEGKELTTRKIIKQ